MTPSKQLPKPQLADPIPVTLVGLPVKHPVVYTVEQPPPVKTRESP